MSTSDDLTPISNPWVMVSNRLTSLEGEHRHLRQEIRDHDQRDKDAFQKLSEEVSDVGQKVGPVVIARKVIVFALGGVGSMLVAAVFVLRMMIREESTAAMQKVVDEKVELAVARALMRQYEARRPRYDAPAAAASSQ